MRARHVAVARRPVAPTADVDTAVVRAYGVGTRECVALEVHEAPEALAVRPGVVVAAGAVAAAPYCEVVVLAAVDHAPHDRQALPVQHSVLGEVVFVSGPAAVEHGGQELSSSFLGLAEVKAVHLGVFFVPLDMI